MAIKAQFGNGPWTSWPQALRLRKPEALARARASLAEEQNFHRFLQYEFYRQWDALRAYAREKGVKMIGDIPIYVPLDSADLWCSPELFQLDHDRQPLCVAGCPPDSFSQEGQYWGNPLYDWSRMERDGFAWWLRRIAAAGRLFDVIRIDHFRGFESYWSIPAEADSARAGAWVKGPGMKLIRRIKERFPHLDFIAEDLGFLTDAVREMVAQSGFPGMKVLEFAFDSREPSDYLPHRYGENCVCYTGTHDNATLSQWCRESPPETLAYAREYLHLSPSEDLAAALLRSGLASKANLFVAQMQDYLGLGGGAGDRQQDEQYAGKKGRHTTGTSFIEVGLFLAWPGLRESGVERAGCAGGTPRSPSAAHRFERPGLRYPVRAREITVTITSASVGVRLRR